MIILVGKLHRIQFIAGFESLDDTYEAVQVMTYAELKTIGYDVKTLIYQSCGQESIYDQHEPLFKDMNFFKIQSVTDELAPYLIIPEKIVNGYPTVDVSEYDFIGLGVDLGPIKDPDLIESITDSISEVLTTVHGIDSKPNLFAYQQAWLSDDEYADIEAGRESVRTTVINNYSENIRLRNELTKAQNEIQALRAILENQ